MVMLWNLVVLVGFVVERGGGQKAGHLTYDDFWIRDVACCNWWDSLTKEYLNEINKKLKYDR